MIALLPLTAGCNNSSNDEIPFSAELIPSSKGGAGKYRPSQYHFHLLLAASNQAVIILKQLFNKLSFQKN